MTVYVDQPDKQFGRMLMCHMIADTDAELRAMADVVGVSQRWHQGDHFDISKAKRALAVRAGARPLSNVELGRIVLRQRRAARLAG
jgi:hypothetical protein